MNNNNFKPSTDERPFMIVFGIVVLYLLICSFILYFYLIHRLSSAATIISVMIFTIVYLPRFLIIKQLQDKDIIKITGETIIINGREIYLDDILAFRTEDKKPCVVFFINNKIIAFNKTTFTLRLPAEEINFTAIGSEKIRLLKEFFENILQK